MQEFNLLFCNKIYCVIPQIVILSKYRKHCFEKLSEFVSLTIIILNWSSKDLTFSVPRVKNLLKTPNIQQINYNLTS